MEETNVNNKKGDTGILLNGKNIKLHRTWFKQMCSLIGINVDYYVPLSDPSSTYYNRYGELNPEYLDSDPDKVVTIGCIYDEHPTQKTMRKLGWNAELAETSVVIHVPYDLDGLRVGCRFDLPAGIDGADKRKFKVLRMSTVSVYPASVACELGPVLDNMITNMLTDENVDLTDPKAVKDVINDFDKTNFNLLNDESETYGH